MADKKTGTKAISFNGPDDESFVVAPPAVAYVQRTHKVWTVEEKGVKSTFNVVAIGTAAGVIHVHEKIADVLEALGWSAD